MQSCRLVLGSSHGVVIHKYTVACGRGGGICQDGSRSDLLMISCTKLDHPGHPKQHVSRTGYRCGHASHLKRWQMPHHLTRVSRKLSCCKALQCSLGSSHVDARLHLSSFLQALPQLCRENPAWCFLCITWVSSATGCPAASARVHGCCWGAGFAQQGTPAILEVCAWRQVHI